MTGWQRRARAGFGIFAVVFAVILYFATGTRQQPVPATPPPRLDPKATVETRGGNIIQLKGERQDVRVEFDGQVTYEDGQSKFLGVTAFVDNRGGRSFTITGKEGQLGPNQSTIDLFGDVVFETSDGLTAHAREAHYVESEGIVKAPGPVTFTRGRMSGSGVGFTYDQQRDTLWLLDQAVVHFAQEGDLAPMDVTAGAWGYAKADRYMRFERTMHMLRDGQVIDADDATVHLLPDRDEPDAIELRGHSRITGGTGLGSLRAMEARDINLDYAEDGRTLERVALAAGARIQTATTTGAPGQDLSAEWIDLTMAPDGAITSLNGRDNVRVTLPATEDAPARTIASTSLSGSGAAGQGLTAMHFAEGVDFKEAAGKDRPARVARSRTLDVALAPGTGELQDARFSGAFSFQEGALTARSATAVYQVTKGILNVTGRDGAITPQVADARMTVDADAIEVTLSPRHLSAKGNVRSVLKAGREQQKGPSLLSSSEAAFVTAGTLTYDEASGLGVYAGGARLWQGETTVRAEAITLDDKRGDLRASGDVVSTLPLASATADASGAKPQTSLGRAAEFTYDDERRRAVYTTRAQLNGPEGNLSGDRIELVLADDQNALDRMEATGEVRVIVDKRDATGRSLTYNPHDASYEIVGSPAKFLEECRETTGRTLTFYRASDKIVVDGNQETRTQTRGGGKCPEPRFE